MDINLVSAIAQDTLTKVVNGELSHSKTTDTVKALGKVMQVELAKIKYQQHIGTVEKIPFFEGE
jgi:hypothetical protein